MKDDVAPDPGDVGLLGPAAPVPCLEGLADAVEEARPRGSGMPASRKGPVAMLTPPAGSLVYRWGEPASTMVTIG